MSNIFLISDTHFGHKSIISFTRNDGSPLRPYASTEEMDEAMVENWNKVVRPQDKVYHLGDVAMNAGLWHMSRLNGKKILIKGNHDKDKLSKYMLYFDDVRGSHQFDGLLLTHIPVHPNSLGRWPTNVHGHTHSNVVTRDVVVDTDTGDTKTIVDSRYFCVSVEQINYTPISLEELRTEVKARQEKLP